jgi:hypothetical protein
MLYCKKTGDNILSNDGTKDEVFLEILQNNQNGRKNKMQTHLSPQGSPWWY